jgi:hypothetical protein
MDVSGCIVGSKVNTYGYLFHDELFKPLIDQNYVAGGEINDQITKIKKNGIFGCLESKE